MLKCQQSFFKPQSFLRYNMFNHYFFDGKKAKETYQNFIAEKESKYWITMSFLDLIEYIDLMEYSKNCIKIQLY